MLFSVLKNFFNKRVAISTFCIWLLLNVSGIQNIFFATDNLNIILVLLEKIMHWFFLYILLYIFKLIYDKRHDEVCKHGIIIFSVYFVLTSLLLLLIWPGTWSWDDILVLIASSKYNLSAWQHFLTSLFQIMCLQTLPFAGGIIIMQNLIASMIVGYCVSKIASLISNVKKTKIITEILLFMPAILPPVLLYLFSGFRMGIYVFFELLLITRLFVIYKEQIKISLSSLIVISSLTILVASWRTEGIYYLLCFLIILLFLGCKIISFKSVFISFIVCCIMVIGIGKANNYLIGNNNYSITATIQPVQALVKFADKEKYNDELEKLNKVIDINMIYNIPDWDGAAYYWAGIVYDNYSDKDYSNYLKAYLKLAFNYPIVTLKSMGEIFIDTSGLFVDSNGRSLQTTLIDNTLTLDDTSTNHGKKWSEVNTIFKQPINNNLRDLTIRNLGCIDKDNKVNSLYYLFWNLFIPLILVSISLIYKLFKKEWFMAFLILTVILRVPIIFMTSSTSYIMYYLSTYLVSYFISFVVIIEFIVSFKRKLYEKQN